MPDTRAHHLQAQTRCPTCGERQVQFQTFGLAGSALLRFACGASYSTFSDLEIRNSRPCPVPARVAAQLMEHEAAEMERLHVS